jgi:3-oxoacyl-[acyl-carrier protein] reductase
MGVLSGRVALVTGSSRGIGAAIARLFAAEGAKVALHGRDRAALDAVGTAIGAADGSSIQVTGDVASRVELEEMCREIERVLGPIDILVANAGGNYAPPGPLEETVEERWRATIEGNLTATFLTIASVLPGMKERRRGVIITISSAAARRPHLRSPIAYAAAKAGIEILTRHLAMQVGAYGIRVNCIAPETILTERNRVLIPEAQQRALAEAHPVQRLGVPEDVAQAALFLASDASAWITGIVLDVAGGAVMV